MRKHQHNSITCKEAILFVDKAKRKLGPAYDLVHSIVSENSEIHSWEVIKPEGARSVKFRCTKCGYITPVARKHCPECGANMLDDSNHIRKVQ